MYLDRTDSFPNSAINPAVQKRCCALLLHDGYGECLGLVKALGFGQVLVNAEVETLGVFEPCRLLCAEHTYVVHRLQPRKVVVLKHYASALQLIDARSNVADAKADRRVICLGPFRLRKQRERGAAHHVYELAIGFESAWFQSLATLVERAGAVHVLYWQHRCNCGIGQHGKSFRSTRH